MTFQRLRETLPMIYNIILCVGDALLALLPVEAIRVIDLWNQFWTLFGSTLSVCDNLLDVMCCQMSPKVNKPMNSLHVLMVCI